ncbi:MAG: hypothetical protein AAFQ87_20220, partial [Bacteroidota bacterium]
SREELIDAIRKVAAGERVKDNGDIRRFFLEPTHRLPSSHNRHVHIDDQNLSLIHDHTVEHFLT